MRLGSERGAGFVEDSAFEDGSVPQGSALEGAHVAAVTDADPATGGRSPEPVEPELEHTSAG